MSSQGPDKGFIDLRFLLEILMVAIAAGALYLQYQALELEKDARQEAEQERQEAQEKNKALTEDKKNLEERVAELQEPLIVSADSIPRPVKLETNMPVKSQTCSDGDVEVKLQDILFDKGYRMTWTFEIKNKTSVKQDISLNYASYFPMMALRDNKGNDYKARHTDLGNEINAGATMTKGVQFDSPKDGATRLDTVFRTGNSSCMNLSPFSIQLPPELLASES